ncbi:MAG: heavy-metal-associated domain-containing protein [Candidatus Aenigmarchaeota archaeon]|nr:heavy-metal-associated domain-containing protein [Candidatus Aenigmarchaeota archaeon]
MEKEISVKGMTCKNCSDKIEKELKETDGVKDVKIDLIKDTVTVKFDSEKVDIENIKSKIDGLGYSTDGKTSKNRTMMEGIAYGLIPHIGCIAFIVGSILGVTLLMEFFRPILMNRWFFHILFLVSVGFATLSSVIYLRKNGMCSVAGAKKKRTYLGTMYGSTIGINLVLFMLIFPLLANISVAAPITGGIVAASDMSSIKFQVDIPCPGHAPLISQELKTIDGVLGIEFSFPNYFDVDYDSSRTSKEEMLELEVFDEYPATVVGGGVKQAAPRTIASGGSCGGSCGGSSCGGSSCGCGG